MSGPNRPKRPSARPTSRPDVAVASEAARVRENTPAEPAPARVLMPPALAEPTASASSAPGEARSRPPRVSARRSSPNLSAPPSAEAPRERPTVHTAPTVVPALGKAPPRADKSASKAAAKAARTGGKKARPAAEKPPAVAQPLRAETSISTAGSAVAEPAVAEPVAPADTPRRVVAKTDVAPTRRPVKSRSSRGSSPEEQTALQPGVVPVEADDTWNAEAPAPAELNPFDSADPQQGLTRETIAARILRAPQPDAQHQDAERSAAHSILASDYYARQYGAHGLRSLAADVDEFGFDPYVEERARRPLELLVQRYFRVQFEGAQRVPSEGRALFVANRAGALPWDSLVLRTMLRSQRPELPALRWLAEDDVIHYPFLGVFMNRLGAVRACPENAERLLTRDRLVAVFPEGAQGSRKSFDERYRLQRFGRGGYIRLALKLGVPIFPTAIVGAEDVHPTLGRSRLLGRLFGADSLPITPTFPWLGALGLLPAPVKWRVVIGEPVDLSAYGEKAADDALVVHRLNEQVRGILQSLLDAARSKRGHALFG